MSYTAYQKARACGKTAACKKLIQDHMSKMRAGESFAILRSDGAGGIDKTIITRNNNQIEYKEADK